jgi:RNA polymerase sigma factor (sigma-70 family)
MPTRAEPEMIESVPEWHERYRTSYERDAPRIQRALQRTFPLSTREDVEDAVEEGYQRVFARLRARENVSSISGCVREIAFGLLLRGRVHEKFKQRKARAIERLITAWTRQAWGDLFDHLHLWDRRRAVRKAMNCLTPDQCEVFLLKSEGMSFREIGERLGVSTSRAAQILNEAIDMLRERTNGRA